MLNYKLSNTVIFSVTYVILVNLWHFFLNLLKQYKVQTNLHVRCHINPLEFSVHLVSSPNIFKSQILHYIKQYKQHSRTPQGYTQLIILYNTFIICKISCCTLVSLKLRNGWVDLADSGLKIFVFWWQPNYFSVGSQQGDPLGPLVYSLAIHKVIPGIKSPFNVWCLDGGTFGGKTKDLLNSFLASRIWVLGLSASLVLLIFTCLV